MRILLASRNFFPKGTVGGAQVSMLLLGQQLQRVGHDVAILSVDDEAHRGTHEASGLFEYRVKLRNLYSRGPANPASKVLWHATDRFGDLHRQDYRECLRDFKPDVVNTNVMAGLTLAIWKEAHAAGIPVIHTIHDYYLTCLTSGMRDNGHNCVEVCAKCQISALAPSKQPSEFVSEVIYVSEHMKRAHLGAGLFKNAGASIIHGSYTPKRPVPPRSGAVNPGVLTIGYFGRLSPEKGVDKLLKSLSRLTPGTWKLRIGGGGEQKYIDYLKGVAGSMPVEFLGVLNPDDFYASIDTVVVSSLWNDPAPRVAYEAGIHGVIPIVANRGGLPELVKNGNRGLIFEPDDDRSLVKAIETFAGSPELLHSFQREWDGATHTFSPAHVATSTLEIFDRAIYASKYASA